MSLLVGHWTGDDGKVAETAGRSAGTPEISVEAGGAVMQRRDRAELFDAAGKQTGSFAIFKMIYAENGAVRAAFADGSHVIHSTQTSIDSGHEVSFESATSSNAPKFRLSYTELSADLLAIDFAVEPPGQSRFQPIASGHLHCAGP